MEEKSEIIGEWIRGRPAGGQSAQHSSSKLVSNISKEYLHFKITLKYFPGISLRRVFDMVKLDDSSADIRDMNRRLQRMLEETLSKNILLQKVMISFNDFPFINLLVFVHPYIVRINQNIYIYNIYFTIFRCFWSKRTRNLLYNTNIPICFIECIYIFVYY